MSLRRVLLAGAFIVGATHSASAQNVVRPAAVICVPSNGPVRVIRAAEACRRGESRLTLAQYLQQLGVGGEDGAVGPMGPEGPQGPAGPVGPAGPMGPEGPQGPQGERGERGDAGAPGERGADGRQGIDGRQGVDGAPGLQGAPGQQGDRGERGEVGPQGERGFQGERGPQGDRGEKGDKGEKGEPGEQGAAGTDGPQGAKGDPGISAADVTPIIWSGGCMNWGRNPGWNPYCFTGMEFNTAGDHLTVGEHEIAVLRAGFYRVTFNVLSIGPSTNAVRLRQNDVVFHQVGVAETGSYPDSWRDTSVQIVYPFLAGDRLGIDVLNPGSFAYHWWHYGTHSRLQVTYVGPLEN